MSLSNPHPGTPASSSDLEILRAFEPIVRYTKGEKFYPMAVEPYLRESSLWLYVPDGADREIVAQGELTVDALVEPRDAPFGSIFYLRFVYPLDLHESTAALAKAHRLARRQKNEFHAGVGRLARGGLLPRLGDGLFSLSLLLRGNVPGATAAAAELKYARIREDEPRFVYQGRVARQSGWTICQYWFFFAYNPWRSGFHGVNDHESDWEMISVYLYEDAGRLVPEWVAYASHDFHGADLRRRWDDRSELEVEGTHPVVYAGAGSHAAYFRRGEYQAEVPIPFSRRLRWWSEATGRFWQTRLGQEGGTRRALRIPFIDFARGDGVAVGPGQENEWTPNVIDETTPWAGEYRGLWGLYAQDPISGENAPAGPMYERDGSPRPSWFDPLGFAGLDRVPPPPREIEALEHEQERIDERQRELGRLIPEETAMLQELGVRLDSMRGSPHLASESEELGAQAEDRSAKLRELRKERFENEAVLEGLRRRLERRRAGETGDPRAHITHAAEPVASATLRFNRAAEIWAALSISALLIGLAILILASPSNVWAELVVLVLAFIVAESVLRGTFARTVNMLAVLAALAAIVVLFFAYWKLVVVALLLALAAFLLYQRFRSHRVTSGADSKESLFSVRVFSSPAGQPRFRRATDILTLVVTAIGVVLLVVAYPPSTFERSLDRFFAAIPGWLDPAWRFLYDMLGLWAIVLVVGCLVARRWAETLEAVAAFVLAVVVALVSTRFAVGHWPAVWDAVSGGSGSSHFPAALVAEATAVVLTVNAQLVRPLQAAGRWIVALGVFGVLVAADVTPGGTAAGFLAAVAAASAVRLAFGTSSGRPETLLVAAGLRELGVQADGLTVAERQRAGMFALNARDRAGRPLLVKVYGRDAYDTQLASKLWRTVLYQDAGPRLRLTRGQAVEHEALVTLLARNAGVPTRTVVTAAETSTGDALIVFHDPGESLVTASSSFDDRLLGRSWRSLSLLHGANIGHRQVDLESVAIVDGDVGLVDFVAATVSPSDDQLRTDRAQLLATTAAVAGTDRAVHAAVESLGAEGVAALLPYLQPAALRTPLRKAVTAAGIDVDELRAQAAGAVGVELPEPIKLRRMTWWSAAQVVLLVLAATAVISFATTIDWDALWSDLSNAAWGWIVFGFVLAQAARVTQATASLGSIAADLPFGRIYMKQLATSYMNLAVPSHVARTGVDIRFFQCQGLPGPTAVTAGVIDSVASSLVQGTLLALLLVFSEANLSLDLNTPSGDPLRLLWILLGLVVVVAGGVVLVKRIRRTIVERVRTWLPQMRSGLNALRDPRKLAMLIGGNIATELLFASALGLFCRSLGYPVGLPDLLVINMSVSLLASFVPVPGGVGVTEFGLTLGLTSAGMPEEAALAAVLLYRISSFYLPPVWGFFALRWLQRNRYL